MRCSYETEACKKHVHCTTCSHYVEPEIITTKLYHTNGDYLRNASNDEVAKFLVYKVKCTGCNAENCDEKFCIGLMKEWIKDQYEER